MIYTIMAVYDHKARAFLPPFFVSHQDVGMRMVASAANKPDHQLCEFAQDFTVFNLGTWNDETAAFGGERAESLCMVSTLKKAFPHQAAEAAKAQGYSPSIKALKKSMGEESAQDTPHHPV